VTDARKYLNESVGDSTVDTRSITSVTASKAVDASIDGVAFSLGSVGRR